MSDESPDSWTLTGKIYSAKCRLELDHGYGLQTIELLYFDSIPVVVAHVDYLSAELEKVSKDYALRLQDLAVLLDNAANVLGRVIEPIQSTQEKPAAAG